jgi:putative ABC transport system permease protein
MSSMRDVLRDVRHALRLMARAPAFTVLAVLTLSLGVGANTAIFSVVNALVLRPLPYPAPERLAFIDGAFERPEGVTSFQLSYPELSDLVASARSFSTIAPWSTGYGLTLEGRDGAARLQANFVGRSYFDVLGTRPAIGRAFMADDHVYGDDGRMVVIISDGIWRQQFASDSTIVGREIRLQGRMFTVVGVMPPSFDDAALAYTERVDVWVPLERASALAGIDLTNRGGRLMWGLGRLADGVALAEAQAELALPRRIRPPTPRSPRAPRRSRTRFSEMRAGRSGCCSAGRGSFC